MSKKVMLAMSGGVDSSVALIMLQNQGYEVIGATMRLYDNKDIGDKSSTCCSLNDVEDARAVASRFGVPHYVFNFTDRFRKDVIERFNNEYLHGLTPNPCIDCNRFLKFSALLERAEMMECDYIATGHYARIRFDEQSGRYKLMKAAGSEGENNKDQSYVLYDLTQEQMKKVLFPLGELEKSEVRKIAKDHRLVNHNKPDSQDICFVPDGDYARFIREYTGIIPAPGDVVDSRGNVLGRHEGIINYTIGQRKGLGIAFGKPMYVIDKNVADNTVTVGENRELFSDYLKAVNVNIIADVEFGKAVKCKAKTRYKQIEQPCEAVFYEDRTAEVMFDEPQRAVTKGQRVVFYDGDVVLGGGVIA